MDLDVLLRRGLQKELMDHGVTIDDYVEEKIEELVEYAVQKGLQVQVQEEE